MSLTVRRRDSAGGGLGDPQEGCYGTDLPGDQLTGTLPIQVHAGRGELLQEHVDLTVEPRTSGHVASLPSSATEPGYSERPVAGNPAVLSPLSPLAVPLLLKPRDRRRRPAAETDKQVLHAPEAVGRRRHRLQALGVGRGTDQDGSRLVEVDPVKERSSSRVSSSALTASTIFGKIASASRLLTQNSFSPILTLTVETRDLIQIASAPRERRPLRSQACRPATGIPTARSPECTARTVSAPP